MSDLERIFKQLQKNRKSGVSVGKLSRLARVPRDSVRKRIWDLRNLEGRRIYTNYQTVRGERQAFYRLSA